MEDKLIKLLVDIHVKKLILNELRNRNKLNLNELRNRNKLNLNNKLKVK